MKANALDTRQGGNQEGSRWMLLLPPVLVIVAFAITIIAGLIIRNIAALQEANINLFKAINGLSCGLPPSDPFFNFMWVGFNNTAINYIILYSIVLIYVFVTQRHNLPKVVAVGLVVAFLGFISNPIIWNWAWGPRPFVITDTCIMYPDHKEAWSQYSSYPSGHARETAAEVTVLVTFWRRILPLGILYLLLLVFSRMYIGVHLPFDVLAGTLLGWGIAQIAFLSYSVYVAPAIQYVKDIYARNRMSHA